MCIPKGLRLLIGSAALWASGIAAATTPACFTTAPVHRVSAIFTCCQWIS